MQPNKTLYYYTYNTLHVTRVVLLLDIKYYTKDNTTTTHRRVDTRLGVCILRGCITSRCSITIGRSVTRHTYTSTCVSTYHIHSTSPLDIVIVLLIRRCILLYVVE